MALKHINYNESYFMADGRKFLIEKEMSLDRYIKFEEIQNKLAWGLDFKSLHAKLTKIYDLLNKSKPADAAVNVFNTLEMISQRVNERIVPALQLCTLFINEEEEDRKAWSEQLAEDKIKAWNAEGYDVNDFFVLALNMVDGLVPVLNGTSPNISAPENTEGRSN